MRKQVLKNTATGTVVSLVKITNQH